jgi:hypothetical protein
MMQEIAVILNVLNSHPRPHVPLARSIYETYFSRHAVPPVRVIADSSGTPSVIVVDKAVALNHLKETYGFCSVSEIERTLEEARGINSND